MPKQVVNIQRFHGGLSTNSDPRDIEDSELTTATDVMVDEIGKIRLMGGTTDHISGTPEDDQGTGWTGTLVPGYGAFQFSNDRTGAEDAGSAEAETGDDYLALYDDNDQQVWIYSKVGNVWQDDAASANNAVIDIGSTGSAKPTFYYVDGALRVSDGNFGANNSNKWYGYIDRTWFPNLSGYSIDQWYTTTQKIEKPQASYYDKAYSIASAETGVTDVIGTAVNVYTKTETRANINTAFAASGAGNESVVRCVVYYYYTVASGGADITLKIKAGPYDTTGGWDADAVEKTEVNAEFKLEGNHASSVAFTYDAADTAAASSWASGGGTNQWRVEITTSTGTASKFISNAIVYEGASGNPELDSGGSTFTNGYVTGNNVAMLFDWADTSNGLGWQNSDGDGYWNVGATFIYDEKQESQITELFDETDGTTVALDVASGENIRPAIILAIADPSHNGAGDGDGTTWNKRVTGCNIYMQDVGQDKTQPWYLQLSANFITGVLRIENTQKEYDAEHNSDAANQSYYLWNLPATELSSPSSVTTYEANSGMEEEEKSIISEFKTAVVANRMAYIGGLQVLNEDGTKEVRGDAIIKSLVNKFDTFPLSRVIEASIRDGDEIVKIEEYADRLLEFKKKKMSLINISQEIEFLEDVFMHKGVSHPAAVCKTDYGIAWVNSLGCYLYNGKQVSNLLEKGGRQIIKESEWDSFVVEPMIGYVPKKRQIIVVDDITTGGTGAVFLYDMVTQSWVKGAAATFTDQNKTNFVTDWNGDLIHAHTSGTVLKWDDASDASTLASAITKDIDFGQPGVRKKVYRVYVTYKGSTDTNMDVFFDVDGGTSLNKTFANGTNFSGNQLDGSSTWAVAELKPATSSQANNIKSFRLKFVSNGTTPSDFEINDISIAYRLKHIK